MTPHSDCGTATDGTATERLMTGECSNPDPNGAGECNFSGLKTSLSDVIDSYSGADGWYTLLDAAKLAATSPIDLHQHRVDFMAVSFYKIFGLPSGQYIAYVHCVRALWYRLCTLRACPLVSPMYVAPAADSVIPNASQLPLPLDNCHCTHPSATNLL